MAQQRQRAVADQVDRRLVAGDEQQDAGGEQLVLGELVPRLLGGDQGRQQIVARRGAALGDESRGSSRPARGGRRPLRDLGVRRQHDRVEPSRDVEAPALEALVILHGDAQHLADDDHGNRVGELLDQVHAALALDPGEQAVDDLLDVGRNRSTTRGVNALLTRPRRRVWSGGSRSSMDSPMVPGEMPKRAATGGDHGLLGEARIAQHRHHVVVAVSTQKPSGL